MKAKFLTEYSCDAGSCVINGIGINNGSGDGTYDVYYVEEPEDWLKAKAISDIWIDLRNGYDVCIHSYDCAEKDDKRFPVKVFTREEFGNAQALQIVPDDGTIYLIKYF